MFQDLNESFKNWLNHYNKPARSLYLLKIYQNLKKKTFFFDTQTIFLCHSNHG